MESLRDSPREEEGAQRTIRQAHHETIPETRHKGCWDVGEQDRRSHEHSVLHAGVRRPNPSRTSVEELPRRPRVAEGSGGERKRWSAGHEGDQHGAYTDRLLTDEMNLLYNTRVESCARAAAVIQWLGYRLPKDGMTVGV